MHTNPIKRRSWLASVCANPCKPRSRLSLYRFDREINSTAATISFPEIRIESRIERVLIDSRGSEIITGGIIIAEFVVKRDGGSPGEWLVSRWPSRIAEAVGVDEP